MSNMIMLKINCRQYIIHEYLLIMIVRRESDNMYNYACGHQLISFVRKEMYVSILS